MRALVFVDYENIWHGLRERGVELTPERLVQFLQYYEAQRGIELLAIYLYANFDREEFWRTQTSFEKTNIYTRHVFGKNNYTQTDLRKNAADTELMLEAQEILLTRTLAFDMFLLLTGDGDFLPLVRKARAWGKEVKVIGVFGNVHQSLQQYCESVEILMELMNADHTEEYTPDQDIQEGIKILAQMQLRMPYVASTKARAAMGDQMGRTLPQVKRLIQYALREKIMTEYEYPDPSLKIGRTKIYLLNLGHSLVQRVLEGSIEELQERYRKMDL